MGIDTPLYEIGSFRYKANLPNGLIEHEIDHVFIGRYHQDQITPNKEEVENYQWISLDKLVEDLKNSPQNYTPWLQPALTLIINSNAVEEYL